ncbi:MAG: hypothetical protein V1793_00425 [Pseudomonadota bacterium]
MERRTRKKESQAMAFTAVCALLIISGFIFWYVNKDRTVDTRQQDTPGMHTQEEKKHDEQAQVTGTIEKPVTIDYKELNKDPQLTQTINERKKALGITSGLDLIVRSDETFTVGGKTVAMRDILEKSQLRNKEVFEERIGETGVIKPQETGEYGVYVVQPGDNIWNIHFKIIQEYYASRGRTVTVHADEPLEDGSSSGVGKLLKFSESIVIIYNLEDNEIDTDINLLKPLTKILVYNLKEVFNLLEEINFENVDAIRFDGNTIWIPAKQPKN